MTLFPLLLMACASPAKESTPTQGDSTTPTETGTVPDSPPTDTVPAETGTTLTENLPDVDDDGDGYSERQGDCDDEHATVSPALAEDCETWADDDCRNGANDGCRASAHREGEYSISWAGGAVTEAHGIGRGVGSIAGVVCETGGFAVARTGRVVDCPDCIWTFPGADSLEDQYWTGDCEWIYPDLAESSPESYVPPLLTRQLGFTSVNPATGASSDVGWVVSMLVDTWGATAGPGYTWGGSYIFDWDDAGGTAWWWYQSYYLQYYYPYGEPVRDYNP